MSDLSFVIDGGQAVRFAAAPLVSFKLRITNDSEEETVHTVVLRAQIQLEATRRRYSAREQEELVDLFGAPDRWGQTLRSMLWTHANLVVPRFTGSTTAELHVPCTFDFNVATTKYFHGLNSGDIPLCFQFSGTVFYQSKDDKLQVSPISWAREAKYRLPVNVWRDVMNEYYPNTAWLELQRDAFEKLYQYKMREGIPTWEGTIERALASVQGTVRS